MRQTIACVVVSTAVVVGCSACTAGDQVGKGKSMLKNSQSDALVAGLRDADETVISTDVAFYVENNGDAAVELLIWNTPLESELSADVFTVILDGEPMAYQGRLIKRATPAEKDFMVIPAHEKAEAVIDLAVFYDMTAPGEYEVSFTPSMIDGQAHLNEQTPVLLDGSNVTVRVGSQ